MVNYRIGTEGCAYDSSTDTIELCCTFDTDRLTDSELIKYTSDSIVHEFMHATIQKLCNRTVSQLFDIVSDVFRNMDIAYKTLEGSGFLTHPLYIKKHGFKMWMHYYGLTEDKIKNTIKEFSPIVQKSSTWIEVFGMHHLYRFEDEDHTKVLRFNGSLFVQLDYLQEL